MAMFFMILGVATTAYLAVAAIVFVWLLANGRSSGGGLEDDLGLLLDLYAAITWPLLWVK